MPTKATKSTKSTKPARPRSTKQTMPAKPTQARAAVLVNLTIHAFVNEISDKKIAAEVAASHNASSNAGRYLKVRLPPSVLKPIDQVISQARQFHYRFTAPWLDRGVRMMPAMLITSYQNEITLFQGQLQSEVQDLIKQLPKIDAEAQRLRGTMYSADLIPTAETLKNAWDLDVELLPVPLDDDFRIDFLENKFRQKFAENNAKRFSAQGEHAKSLFLTPLIRLEETFMTASPRVRASTIEQLTWVCEHAGDVALDENLSSCLVKHAESVKSGILSHYNPENRPVFDMEAIESSLGVIAVIKKDLQKEQNIRRADDE